MAALVALHRPQWTEVPGHSLWRLSLQTPNRHPATIVADRKISSQSRRMQILNSLLTARYNDRQDGVELVEIL